MPIPSKTLLGGRCRLICGDNETLALQADAVITDPPYGIGYKGGANSSNSISTSGKRFKRTIQGDDKPFDPSKWLVYKQVVFTGAQYFYAKLPEGGMFHCWDKRGNYKPLDQADADMLWVAHPKKPATRPRVFHLAWRGICRHAENRDKILHPTQKPVALMKWAIGLAGLQPGDTVLDPYMGVGSTAIAAIELGFNFIGIEIEREYFQIAVDRVEKLFS